MLLEKTSRAGFSSSVPFDHEDPSAFYRSSPATAADAYAEASPSESFTSGNYRGSGIFGAMADYPITATAPAKSADEIAAALVNFTLQNSIDKRWLAGVIDKGLALGPVPQLKCVYVSPAMNDILDHPQNYGRLTDLLNELDARESEVTGCLDLWDKIFYGTRLRSFGNDLWSQPDFFDKFSLYFAQLLSVTPGKASVNLFSYFFRQDRLDAKSQQVLDLFHGRLKKIVESMPSE